MTRLLHLFKVLFNDDAEKSDKSIMFITYHYSTFWDILCSVFNSLFWCSRMWTFSTQHIYGAMSDRFLWLDIGHQILQVCFVSIVLNFKRNLHWVSLPSNSKSVLVLPRFIFWPARSGDHKKYTNCSVRPVSVPWLPSALGSFTSCSPPILSLP